MTKWRRTAAGDPYEDALLQQLATRATGGFALFLVCLVLASFFEIVRFRTRASWMLGFAAGFTLLVVASWVTIRMRRDAALWVLVGFVNVVGVALNAYHVIVAAPVAMCLWTLTGLLACAALVLRWGGYNQALASIGALLSYPIHWELGMVDFWTWAAGGTYLLFVAGLSVVCAALYDRYQRTGLRLTAVLGEREARLQSYFDLAPVGTAVLDRDGRIFEANDEVCRLLGGSHDEILGRRWPPFDDERFQEAEAPYVAAALAGERRDAPRELWLRRRDGRTITASVGMHGLPGPTGANDHAMVVVQDVTERRRTEAERDEMLARELAARKEAEAASRAKDAFLATLSHELRTPLTPILSWARLLRRGDLDPEETARAAEAIERNARSQTKLVEDLLDISRIMAGKLRVTLSPVDLGAVVRDAVDVVRPAARARGATLTVHGDATTCVVSADAGRLQQVLWNLLSNAIKFTPSGGRVDVTMQVADRVVRVAVSDTGSGIDPEFLPHVFERFRQGEEGPARRHGGLGVGLAIVRELVELHGGTVRARSAGPGRGATFVIELPLAAQPAIARRKPAEPESGEPLRGVRVLLVDDDHDSMEVVRYLLSRSGAQVEAAASARQALDVLGRRPLDVLVSDIAMPDVDGYALLARVRAGEGGQPRLPAIALTAYSTPEARERALSGGFQAHVSKPVELDELVAAVRAVHDVAVA